MEQQRVLWGLQPFASSTRAGGGLGQGDLCPHSPEGGRGGSEQQEVAANLSAESRVPGTGLGSGVLNAAFLVKGRWGLRTQETMCGTEARALSSGLADLGLRTKRVVGTVILTPSLRETSTRVSHRPAGVLLPSIPW